ncbi:MAG TPA: HDIG domain-containing metalloprotein [Nitrospiria bacterium]
MEKEKEGRAPRALKPLVTQYALAVGTLLAVVYLIAPQRFFFAPVRNVGEIVPRDIRAPIDLEIVDEQALRRGQLQAEAGAAVAYDLDPEIAAALDEKLTKAFSAAREEWASGGPVRTQAAAGAVDRTFQEALGIRLSSHALAALRSAGFEEALEGQARRLLLSFLDSGIVSSRVFVAGERREQFVKNVLGIPDLKGAQEQAAASVIPAESPADTPERLSAVRELASQLMIPNLAYNKTETEARKQAAITAVNPLYLKVNKGTLIFRAGDRVAAEDLPVLAELARYQRTGFRAQSLIGLAALAAAILAVMYLDIRRYHAVLTRSQSKMVLVSLLLVGTIALSRFSHFLVGAFADRFPTLDPSTLVYAVPVATGAMLVTLLFDAHLGLIFSFVLSLLMGIAMPEEPLYAFYAFMGSVAAVFGVITCHRRTQMLRAGLAIGLVNVVMAGSILLYKGTAIDIHTPAVLAFAASGGLLAGLIVSGLLPVLEYFFKITTDIRLLELLDLNHPLLRKLSVQAPGTYYHSMMVSNLAEAAAEAIGENPLLARVCCYYHDIGKMVKPEYYIENQRGLANRHDKLSPNMSGLVVASHVKDGLELGRRYKLPQAVLDVIPQHHGTRLMSYFYNRAMKNRVEGGPPVDENDFRYPGPKPQTRLAAIVMLADGAEAASRVLSTPTPPRIATMVERIVNAVYLDHQLAESDLTFRNLKDIQKSFSMVLAGQFHQRIEYPWLAVPENEEGSYDGADHEPAAQNTPGGRGLQDADRKSPPHTGAA